MFNKIYLGILLATNALTVYAGDYDIPENPNNVGDPNKVSVATKENLKQLYDIHNLIRVAFGMNVMKWDSALANEVQTYANSCPGWKHGGPNTWQNLAGYNECKGNECNKSLTSAWLWYSYEIPMWKLAEKQCNTGKWEDCGHLTNMLSPGNTVVACGMSRCSNYPSYDLVWCNYRGAQKDPVIPTPPYDLKTFEVIIKDRTHSLWTKLKEKYQSASSVQSSAIILSYRTGALMSFLFSFTSFFFVWFM